MKKYAFILLFLASASQLFAQVPLAIPYQAVARDTSGTLLRNQNISLRFTLIDSSVSGSVYYTETQSVTTNILATFTANIGMGTPVTGVISSINWSDHNTKYLKVEADPTGGSSYLDLGIQQLFTVPFSFFSGNAATAGSLLSSGSGSNPTTLLYLSNGF